MNEIRPQGSADWPVVQTDAGPVTLAPIDALLARADQWREWAAEAAVTAHSLHSQAGDHFAAAGSSLVARIGEWAVPSDLQTTIEQARALTERMNAGDQRAAALKDDESGAGMFGRIGVRHQEHEVDWDRSAAATMLRALLIPIARSASVTTIPEIDEQRKNAADLESKAAALDAQILAAQGWATACDVEATRRNDAIKAMGFDSLYEAAVLQTSGAKPVSAPLVLKSGEQAYLSAPATLARMATRTQYVGGSSGFSFPIGHTGIRYRVGTFRGQPVHQQSLTKLDAGTLVVTNQGLLTWAELSRQVSCSRK